MREPQQRLTLLEPQQGLTIARVTAGDDIVRAQQGLTIARVTAGWSHRATGAKQGLKVTAAVQKP